MQAAWRRVLQAKYGCRMGLCACNLVRPLRRTSLELAQSSGIVSILEDVVLVFHTSTTKAAITQGK